MEVQVLQVSEVLLVLLPPPALLLPRSPAASAQGHVCVYVHIYIWQQRSASVHWTWELAGRTLYGLARCVAACLQPHMVGRPVCTQRRAIPPESLARRPCPHPPTRLPGHVRHPRLPVPPIVSCVVLQALLEEKAPLLATELSKLGPDVLEQLTAGWFSASFTRALPTEVGRPACPCTLASTPPRPPHTHTTPPVPHQGMPACLALPHGCALHGGLAWRLVPFTRACFLAPSWHA